MMRLRILTRSLAGHSHYQNIRHRKARVDMKRQSAFQKLSSEIYASIKAGGSADPSANARLARALGAARRGSMPKERVERALRTGRRTVGEETVVFEGVFPGGVGVLVRASAGRRNAVAGEKRTLFRRADGEMGRAGWMFMEKFAVVVAGGGDDAGLCGMEEGAEEVEMLDDGVEMFCGSLGERERIRKGVAKRFGDDCVYSVRRIEAKWFVRVEGERAEKLERLFGELDDHDEVVDVVHNAELW